MLIYKKSVQKVGKKAKSTGTIPVFLLLFQIELKLDKIEHCIFQVYLPKFLYHMFYSSANTYIIMSTHFFSFAYKLVLQVITY